MATIEPADRRLSADLVRLGLSRNDVRRGVARARSRIFKISCTIFVQLRAKYLARIRKAMDTDNSANWREKGVANWARDRGFVVMQEDGLFTMWSSNSPMVVLERVDLDEVERYLSTH